MANADHLTRLSQGVDGWNAWRKEEPWVRPDLGGAKLDGAQLVEANLFGANLYKASLYKANLHRVDLHEAVLVEAYLREADLRGAKLNRAQLVEANLFGANLYRADLGVADLHRADLHGAVLVEAYLREADLCGANLSDADLSKANLRVADLRVANLSRALLGGADLKLANLVDARFDGADLTDTKLWETQRSGWSIKDVICQRAFWDREGKELIEYGEGEFERIFAEKPRIVLRYPGGMSPVDLFALPLVVEHLQAEHPDSVLQVRSVQNDAGGTLVTITVEDLKSRNTEAFEHELVRLRAKLECIVEERDHLRRCLSEMFFESISKAVELLALPRQEIHIHRPSGQTAIEGPAMSRDTYNVSGQAGAVGPGARAERNTFQQIQGGIDLPKLAEELGRLREAMKGEATGTREQDKAIGTVADAEEAAAKGDGPAVLQHLKSAGKWALGIAEKIGVAVAVEALKRVM